MYCRLELVVLSLCVGVGVSEILPDPEVTIEQGTLTGKYETTAKGRNYAAFLGIPYVEPPLGQLRFKEPKPPKPWVGVYNATKLGSDCLQYSHLTYSVLGDEDCLFVNVYTPDVSNKEGKKQLLDVIVYIHGGCFNFLNGNAYGPRYLLDRDVVYVTFNYRIGIFGFLSTEDAVIPGNNGLKDQSAVLRWVQKNIGAFGGNPNSVTLIGLSAGGISVHFHYLSPLSQGLFKRGISFSGSTLCPWALMENGRKKAIQLGSSLGCNTNNSSSLLSCLHNRSADQIIQQAKQFLGWLYNPISAFGPTVEVNSAIAFITQEPYQILKAGNFQHLPWIASVTSEEGLYPGIEMVSAPKHLKDLDKNWYEYLPHLLEFNYTVNPELKRDVCDAIKQHYLKNTTTEQNPVQFIQMVGDRLFVAGPEEAAKVHAESSTAPVYFYYFTYNGDHSMSSILTRSYGNKYGVNHGDDVVYFLNSKYMDPMTAVDQEMSDRFLDFLTSYARDGIPKFTPNFVFPTVKDGLPALQYVNIKSPNQFVTEQSTNLGQSKFWYNLPLLEGVNLARKKQTLNR